VPRFTGPSLQQPGLGGRRDPGHRSGGGGNGGNGGAGGAAVLAGDGGAGAAPGVAGSTGRAWPPPVIVGVGGGDGLIFGAPGGE
jgi:hypothetical protein